jgi:hypothetical protein
VFYNNYWFFDRVIKFNEQSKDCKIEIVTYYDETGDYINKETGKVNDSAIEKLALDITTGNAPDIIDVSKLRVRNYAAKGLFEDLEPYINSDPELSRDDILQNIWEALEIDGHVYQTVTGIIKSTGNGKEKCTIREPNMLNLRKEERHRRQKGWYIYSTYLTRGLQV